MSAPTPNLPGLPTELLVEILKYLPAREDKVCLGITCKELYAIHKGLHGMTPDTFEDMPFNRRINYRTRTMVFLCQDVYILPL